MSYQYADKIFVVSFEPSPLARMHKRVIVVVQSVCSSVCLSVCVQWI